MFVTHWSSRQADCHHSFFIVLFLGTSISVKSWSTAQLLFGRPHTRPYCVWISWLDTGQAVVEALYSNIVIAVCLRMVGSSCLYICVYVYNSWLVLCNSHVLHLECTNRSLMLRWGEVSRWGEACATRSGGCNVGYQSAVAALEFVCEFWVVWSESAVPSFVGICVLHAMARWWVWDRWLPCPAGWYCETSYVQLVFSEERAMLTSLLWWDPAVMYGGFKKKRSLASVYWMLLVLKDGLMHRKVFLLLPTCFSHFPIKLFKVLCELLVFCIDWSTSALCTLRNLFISLPFCWKIQMSSRVWCFCNVFVLKRQWSTSTLNACKLWQCIWTSI